MISSDIIWISIDLIRVCLVPCDFYLFNWIKFWCFYFFFIWIPFSNNFKEFHANTIFMCISHLHPTESCVPQRAFFATCSNCYIVTTYIWIAAIDSESSRFPVSLKWIFRGGAARAPSLQVVRRQIVRKLGTQNDVKLKISSYNFYESRSIR